MPWILQISKFYKFPSTRETNKEGSKTRKMNVNVKCSNVWGAKQTRKRKWNYINDFGFSRKFYRFEMHTSGFCLVEIYVARSFANGKETSRNQCQMVKMVNGRTLSLHLKRYHSWILVICLKVNVLQTWTLTINLHACRIPFQSHSNACCFTFTCKYTFCPHFSSAVLDSSRYVNYCIYKLMF